MKHGQYTGQPMNTHRFPIASANLSSRSRWTPAFLLLFFLAACAPSQPEPRPVILVTVDALRADRVGLYGPSPLPTPNLDRIGREGAIFWNAMAPIGRTTQGIGTVMTGLHPLAHGADGLGMVLPLSHRTLAQAFREAGYRTAAFSSNLFLRPGLGFEKGFDLFANPEPRWEGNSASALTAEASAWIESLPRDGKPFFLWLHLLDPHWTYQPAEEFAHRADPDWRGSIDFQRFRERGSPISGRMIFSADRELPSREVEHIRRLYNAEVVATDQAIGKLLAGLERTGWMEKAILVLTADHGESLGEHGYWFAHGEYAYEESLRIPLLIRAPGLIPPGTRISGPVSQESIAPTLADLTRLPAFPTPSPSLAPALLAGGAQTAPPTAVIHLSDHQLVHAENPRRPVSGREGRWWAIREGAWKLIRIPLGNGRFQEELFDLSHDPGEAQNQVDSRPDVASKLRSALVEHQRQLLAQWQRSGAQEPDTAVPESLRGLGYIN